MNALEKQFNEKVKSQMMEKFGYDNVMDVPRIEKITINVGLSRAQKDADFIKNVVQDIKAVTGQTPVFTKARKAIAGFKIRDGQNVGLAVTLRGKRMWDFVYRLVGVTIPRMKDFQGIPLRSFDKNGNLSIGIREQLIFPEISSDDIKTIFGLQINILTTAKTNEEGIALLRYLGFPLQSK